MRCKRFLAASLAALSAMLTSAIASAAPLAGYWQLNETSTAQPAVDSSGNIAAGTYNVAVNPNVPGPFAGFGTGAQFPAGAGDVNIGGGSQLNFVSDFSVSGWINLDNLSGKHTLIGNGGGGWGVRSNGSAPQITTFGVKDYDGTAGTLTAGMWHHLVVVLDSANDAHFYVDGAPAGISLHNANALGSAASFAIGAVSPGNASESMSGLIDDVGVFSTSLTATEVAAIYNLAVEPGLEYDLGKVNTLLEAFDNGDSLVEIDGVLWGAATGLGGADGEVVDLGDGNFSVNLGNGVGFQTVEIPEPASLVLWSLLGLVGIGYSVKRLRRFRS